MNKNVKFLLYKLNGALKRIGRVCFKLSIKSMRPDTIYYNVGADDLQTEISDYSYMDETGPYIQNIHEYFLYRMLGINKKYNDVRCVNNKAPVFDRKNLIVDTQQHRKKNLTDWVYLYSNSDLPKAYLISFNTVISSQFTEFQIAFRHRSISDRLRFMVLDNKDLVFEVVRHGVFFGTILKVPFSFELNREYKIEIVIDNNHYVFRANDETILSVADNSIRAKVLKPKGGSAFVLWNNTIDHNKNIKASITNISLHTLS